MVEDICSHILLLDEGRQKFFGPIADLKDAFRGQDSEATLERIFFLATRSELTEAAC